MLWWMLIACRPDRVTAEVRVAEPGSAMADGAALVQVTTEGRGALLALIVDGAGEVRWQRAIDGRVARVRPSGDGTILTLIDASPGSPGRVQRETLDGEVLSVTLTEGGHHDVLELADGRLAWLEYREGAAPLPLDPEAQIASDAVVVAAEGGAGEAVFAYLDDYGVDPWFVCDHMAEGQRVPDHYQWTHANSLVQDPSDPTTLGVLSRNLDAVVWFDLTTGAPVAQHGGRDTTLPLGPGAALDHPHLSHAPAPGRLLVFDNRMHAGSRAGGSSRVVEWAVDGAAVEVVWSYEEPGVHVGFLGDARRLPGGTTLITWADERRMTEVSPAGEVLWELVFDDLNYVGRASWWEGPLP